MKDLLSILRLAENPRDTTSAFRVLQLLDGVGPAHARRAIAHLTESSFDFTSWTNFDRPAAAAGQWPGIYAFQGDEAGERFGVSVAGAGDVDGDGRPDLVIGATDGNGASTEICASFALSKCRLSV